MTIQYNNSEIDSIDKFFYNKFPYSPTIELQMLTFYQILSEKDKRLYAATEALKLAYGGIIYISRVLNCDRKTIYRGIEELKHPELIKKDKVRAKGGGRKQSIESISGVDEKFLEVLWNYTAGDPMDEKIRWTDLTCQQIADKLKESGIELSRKIVKKLFKKHGYKKRKA